MPRKLIENDVQKRVMVPMPPALHHRLRVLAAEEQTTMADIIREALEREIARRRDGHPPVRSARKASAA
jgi:predicted DNA-binding protein